MEERTKQEFIEYCNEMMHRGYRCYARQDFPDIDQGIHRDIGIEVIIPYSSNIVLIKDWYERGERR